MLMKMLMPLYWEHEKRPVSCSSCWHNPHQCTYLYSYLVLKPFSLHNCWPKRVISQRDLERNTAGKGGSLEFCHPHHKWDFCSRLVPACLGNGKETCIWGWSSYEWPDCSWWWDEWHGEPLIHVFLTFTLSRLCTDFDWCGHQNSPMFDIISDEPSGFILETYLVMW